MRIDSKQMDGSRNGITLNDRIAYRIVTLGARLIATGSRLRDTEDTFCASVTIREAADCIEELEVILELAESGNVVEAENRIHRLRLPNTIRKP